MVSSKNLIEILRDYLDKVMIENGRSNSSVIGKLREHLKKKSDLYNTLSLKSNCGRGSFNHLKWIEATDESEKPSRYGFLIRYYFTPSDKIMLVSKGKKRPLSIKWPELLYADWDNDNKNNNLHPPNDELIWFSWCSLVRAQHYKLWGVAGKNPDKNELRQSFRNSHQICFATPQDLVNYLLSEDGEKYFNWCNQNQVL